MVEAVSCTVLIVDDDAVFARALAKRLSSLGWEVTVVADGSEAMPMLRAREFDAMVLDLQMPQISGMDVLDQLGDMPAPPATVLLSGHLDIPRTVKAMQAGAVDVMEKPVNGDELEQHLRNAVNKRRNELASRSGRTPPETEPVRLRDLERDLIVRTYESSEQNLSLTARRLGLPRTTVRDKLKRYGVR